MAKVAFTALAQQGGQFGPFPGEMTLVFNKEITNSGKAYDKTSGIFRAPVAGVYYFRFTYHADKKEKSGLTLKKGGSDIVRSFDDGRDQEGYIDNAGNGAVLQLNQGDEVYVVLPAQHQIWAADNTTTFTGFLLFE